MDENRKKKEESVKRRKGEGKGEKGGKVERKGEGRQKRGWRRGRKVMREGENDLNIYGGKFLCIVTCW